MKPNGNKIGQVACSNTQGPNSLPQEVKQTAASSSLTAPTLDAITMKENAGKNTASADKSSLVAGHTSPTPSTSC